MPERPILLRNHEFSSFFNLWGTGVAGIAPGGTPGIRGRFLSNKTTNIGQNMKIHSIFDSANQAQLRRSKERNSLILVKSAIFEFFNLLALGVPGIAPLSPWRHSGASGTFSLGSEFKFYEKRETPLDLRPALTYRDEKYIHF